MFTKTKIALATALVLSSVATALANEQTEERGGFVIPGTMDGVNPVYHPDIFGSANAQTAKQPLQQDRSEWGKPSYRR